MKHFRVSYNVESTLYCYVSPDPQNRSFRYSLTANLAIATGNGQPFTKRTKTKISIDGFAFPYLNLLFSPFLKGQ